MVAHRQGAPPRHRPHGVRHFLGVGAGQDEEGRAGRGHGVRVRGRCDAGRPQRADARRRAGLDAAGLRGVRHRTDRRRGSTMRSPRRRRRRRMRPGPSPPPSRKRRLRTRRRRSRPRKPSKGRPPTTEPATPRRRKPRPDRPKRNRTSPAPKPPTQQPRRISPATAACRRCRPTAATRRRTRWKSRRSSAGSTEVSPLPSKRPAGPVFRRRVFLSCTALRRVMHEPHRRIAPGNHPGAHPRERRQAGHAGLRRHARGHDDGGPAKFTPGRRHPRPYCRP